MMPGLFDPQPQQQTGLFGNLGAGLESFAHSGALLPAIANMFQGFATGQRMDPQGMQMQAINSRYRAVKQLGVPDAVAQAWAMDPKENMQLVAPYLDTVPKITHYPNALTGDTNFFVERNGPNPSVTAIAPGGNGQPGINPNASDIFEQINALQQQGAKREQMLQTIPVQSGLRNAVAGMLEGGLVPSNFSMRGAAHDLAVKIAAAIDPTFNEQELGSRRKMYADLNSSSPNSVGGILSNGKSAFGHLATVADKLVDLGSAPGPNMPFGGHIGSAENYITNELMPSPATKGKLTGINEALLKYGQEATKFYAGTGGGEAERLHALKTMNPGTAIRSEQAEFLKTQRDLMLERLTQKTDQIHTQLGEKAAAKAGLGEHDRQNLARIDAAIAKLEGGSTSGAGGANSAAAPAINEGMTATNPKTGQKVMFKGGQWVPMQ